MTTITTPTPAVTEPVRRWTWRRVHNIVATGLNWGSIAASFAAIVSYAFGRPSWLLVGVAMTLVIGAGVAETVRPRGAG